MNDDESQEPDNEFNDVSVDEIREPDSESNDTPVDEVQAESDAIHAKFIAEPAQEPDEGFGSAFEEIVRLKAIEEKISELLKSNESENLTKKGILEREIEVIRDWCSHKRETPTTGHTLLVDYNLQSKSHPVAADEEAPNKGAITVPAGTEWHDITFRFEDERTATITVKGRHCQRSFRSFDFSFNKRKKSPTILWNNLLNLAVHRGNPPARTKITSKHVSDLRKHIKAIFPGVDGEPIGVHNKNTMSIIPDVDGKPSRKPILVEGYPLMLALVVSESLVPISS